jgi:thioredoxin reductase (NADPH)
VVEDDKTRPRSLYDCLIIGGGPAGLVAATYLGRFRRRVIVVDAGQSRAKWIPKTHNCPGFPDGIAGSDLLERLGRQALMWGAELVDDTVQGVQCDGSSFFANASFAVRARTVLIATGVVDTLPDAPDLPEMIKAGSVRLCPICDAYEVIDKRVAVIGPANQAIKKALFLRAYTSDLTLLVTDAFPDADASELIRKAGVKFEACIPDSIHTDGKRARIRLSNGTLSSFDTIYPAMGCTMRSQIASDLGAVCDEVGNLVVDSHQRTAVTGLYAAGDVVDEINQIAVAFGHAAIAATDMHNYLGDADGWASRERSPLLVP